MFETLVTTKGLLIGETLVFVVLNLVSFFVTLLLIFRLGEGDLAKPIWFFSLSFLVPALTYMVWGPPILWLVPVLQTILSIIGIYILMKVLGVFELISSKDASAKKRAASKEN